MTDLTRVIEGVLREWNEPGSDPAAILPAEHELAKFIEAAVLNHIQGRGGRFNIEGEWIPNDVTPTTGERRTMILSHTAWATICGMVQGSDDVDTTEIFPIADVWGEIRAAFPLSGFKKAVAKGLIDYDPA